MQHVTGAHPSHRVLRAGRDRRSPAPRRFVQLKDSHVEAPAIVPEAED